MKLLFTVFAFLLLILHTGCDDNDGDQRKPLSLVSVYAGTLKLSQGQPAVNVPTGQSFIIRFSARVEPMSASKGILLKTNQQDVSLAFSFSDGGKTVTLNPVEDLLSNTAYTLRITDDLKGAAGENFSGVDFQLKTAAEILKVVQWTIGGESPADPIDDVPLTLDLYIQFNNPLHKESVSAASVSLSGPADAPLAFDFSADGKQLTVTAVQPLRDFTAYTLEINDQVAGEAGEAFTGFQINFYTTGSPKPDFPVLSDDELLTVVQRQTFRYFWELAHPASGMARERNTSENIVTSGGSGFGIMALIVGMERGFVTRTEGLDRIEIMLTFLETADRFHGAWPHWMDGNSGDVIPFSGNDNGGDLVETSFLVQGLLTARQYLDRNVTAEKKLIDRINALWHSVEWDWYTRGGQQVLYWHWSPDRQWAMNHPIRGYNEALITYFLAAASPTHGIDALVYHKGWAGDGAIVNGKSFFDVTLPVGYDYGGPLFFAHYSFLGLDPRGLSDQYANYWTQNVNHSLINHAYCIANPKKFVGYSEVNWGLSASDNHQGYSAHSPTNDLGVITPTAALSSFPYTPENAMKALKFFYYTIGDRLWGPYGFYDAFNITAGWTARSYLAIDQGPIIVMIENYRTGLLWDLFMSSPEVQAAMDKLGFTHE